MPRHFSRPANLLCHLRRHLRRTALVAAGCAATLTACGSPGSLDEDPALPAEEDVAARASALSGPGPVLTSISPNTGTARGGVTLTLTGRNFRPGTKVTIADSLPITAKVVSSTTMTVSLPAKPGAFGRVPVVITRPDGKAVTRTDLFYYYSDKLDFRGASSFGNSPTGDRPLVRDMNGDGKPDLVFVARYGAALGIALAGGTGLLQAPLVTDLAGETPSDVTVGDWNGDKKPDVLVGCTTSPAGSLLLFTGNGDGSLAAPVRLPTLGKVTNVFAQDLNGDGKLDILAAGSEPLAFSTVALYQFFAGKGDGSFEAPVKLALHPASFQSVLLLDATGDGKPDVLRVTSSEVRMFPGKGDGTFGDGVLAASLSNNLSDPPLVADVNGDGKADLLFERYSSIPALYRGKGDGTFTGPTDAGDNIVGSELALCDIDGDGKIDLIDSSSGYLVGSTAVSRGKGDGTFEARQVLTQRAFSRMVFADLTGDGKPELISAGSTEVLVNTGTGFADPEALKTGSKPSAVRLGDVNGDGKADLVIASYDKGTVQVALSDAGGRFGAARTFTAGSGPNSVGLGDFNGDGKVDLAVSNFDSNNVSLLLGNGDGTFATPRNFTVGNGPTGVTVGDFNGDGKPDAATSNFDSDTASVLLNNGTGGFAAAKTYQAQKFPSSIASGDLNGDGRADLVVTNSESGSLSVLLSTATGFLAAKHIAVGPNPLSVAVADLNGDGKLDVAAVTSDDNKVSVLINGGTGALTAATPIPTCGFPSSVVAADLDGDSRSDLAVACDANYDERVAFYIGFGDGAFFPAALSEPTPAPPQFAIGDINGDSKADLVYATEARELASVRLNRTP